MLRHHRLACTFPRGKGRIDLPTQRQRTGNAPRSFGGRALVLLWFALAAGQPRAAEVDTEHLFGFTIGSDIGDKGEKEFESETTARAGKGGGSYSALSQQLESKNTLVRSFRIAPAAVFAYHDRRHVP